MPKQSTAVVNSVLFAVVNHGVSEELVAEVFEQNRAFFALPDEQKRLVLTDCNNRQIKRDLVYHKSLRLHLGSQ